VLRLGILEDLIHVVAEIDFHLRASLLHGATLNLNTVRERYVAPGRRIVEGKLG
jgi:hypothetical protein